LEFSKARVSACMYFLVYFIYRNNSAAYVACQNDECTYISTSFPGLSCKDDGRDEKALVWAGHVSTPKMAVFDSYSSRSGEIFFN
jgi:hypothetical protein